MTERHQYTALGSMKPADPKRQTGPERIGKKGGLLAQPAPSVPFGDRLILG
jgi:hypothetical protein